VTLTASSTASLGQYNIVITGTSGTQTATTTMGLGVYPQGFTLSAYSLNIGQGTSGTADVYVYPQYGFAGKVTLSASGLPSGVTASFAPNPTTGSSTLTLTASSTASLGQYNITITGTSGAITATTILTLGVYVPSFTLSASSPSIGQGTSNTAYVYVYPQYGFTGNVTLSAAGLPSGVTASFAPNPTTGTCTVTLTASSTASLGQYNVTITGTSGTQTATATMALGVYPQSFTMSAYGVNIGQGTSSTAYVYVYPQYGFAGNVTLSASGLPSGVTASFAPNPTTGTSTITLTASSSTSLGQYDITITGTSGTLTAMTTLALGVYPQGFTIYDSPYSLAIGEGSSGTSTIYVTPQYGFSGSVNLVASGLPAGVTATFAPNPISTDSSVLTLTASSTATVGNATVTITGTSGALTATTPLAVTVNITPVPAILLSPTPGIGTILGTSNVTFQWSAGIDVTDYQLNLSAVAPGDSDLYLYKGTALTATVTTLPANGVEVYARLYSKINGAWQYNDYVYTEGGTPTPAALTSPTPGLSTTLGTSNVTFQWNTGIDVTDYQLNLSAVAPGDSDLYLYKGTALTATATTLPANGVEVYARLYSKINGTWQYNDYVYSESGPPTPATLISPTPGLSTILGTSNVLFQWSAGTSATDYQLNLSAIAPGDSDLYLYKGTALSANAPTLPANGVEVYARLYSKINGVWLYNDYLYTEK
jgi:uncharacterized membrane protein